MANHTRGKQHGKTTYLKPFDDGEGFRTFETCEQYTDAEREIEVSLVSTVGAANKPVVCGYCGKVMQRKTMSDHTCNAERVSLPLESSYSELTCPSKQDGVERANENMDSPDLAESDSGRHLGKRVKVVSQVEPAPSKKSCHRIATTAANRHNKDTQNLRSLLHQVRLVIKLEGKIEALERQCKIVSKNRKALKQTVERVADELTSL